MSALAKLRRSSFRFQEVFSSHVVHLKELYRIQLCFHPKKTQRGPEKQLKLGNTLLHSWPGGFRCRTFTMSMHDGHVLDFQNMLRTFALDL